MRQFKDYSEDDVTGWLGRQTPMGFFLKVVAGVIAISLFFAVIGFAAGWFNEGKRIVGVENVREQYTRLYQDYESLEATARNVCRAEASVDGAESADVREQRRSQVLAYEQNYERLAADYDRRWQNAFEAKFVGPRKLPTTAPILEEMKQNVCN